MKNKFKFFIIIVAVNIFLLTNTSAAEFTDKNIKDAWQAVRNGEAVVLMRHAIAPGTGDPANFEINNCASQRLLSIEGRDQARKIGDVLRNNGVDSANLLTSEWCRCWDTAALLEIGVPQKAPMLNSFYQDRSTATAQTQELLSSIKSWLSQHPDEVHVLVTHQVNISALSNEYASSGEMLIVTLENDEVIVLARINTR